MTDLETRIYESIDRLAIPEVDLTEAVLAELPQTRGLAPRSRRAVSVAIAALVVLAGLLVITPTREALADWLGIGATEIRTVPEQSLPEKESTESLGELVTTENTAAVTNLTATTSPIPSLDQPAAVFDDDSRGRSYVWPSSESLPPIADSEIGAVLSVRPADRVLSAKLIASDVAFGPVEIAGLGDGTLAFWIGGEHVLLQAGSSRPVTANQVLLWVSDGVEFRLETALQLHEVSALASEIEKGTDLLTPG
ncbi:MAG: hypothetical protein ACR2NL_01245 [Acidimicrobiia bacterium]